MYSLFTGPSTYIGIIYQRNYFSVSNGNVGGPAGLNLRLLTVVAHFFRQHKTDLTVFMNPLGLVEAEILIQTTSNVLASSTYM